LIKRLVFRTLALVLCTSLTSCAAFQRSPVQPGQTESEVIATLGKPTHRYRDGEHRLLEYMTGPMGQTTYMARIGPDGTLRSYEQVLTLERFSTIEVGHAEKEDVLKTVGAPSETDYFPLLDLEAWSYPYKENGVWDSVMSIYFDQTGTVRRLENGLDPRRIVWD
jgi:outer membrane protein assembly factor BamE (lipoprotein component of BamABCDE complex)